MPAYLLDCTAAEAMATREHADVETRENLIEW
jgi:hypothetical protein